MGEGWEMGGGRGWWLISCKPTDQAKCMSLLKVTDTSVDLTPHVFITEKIYIEDAPLYSIFFKN